MPKKPPKGGAPCVGCVLTVAPNPIPLGTESIVIGGSGFGGRSEVWIATPQDISSHRVAVDALGNFSFTYERLWHIPDTAAPIKAYGNAGKYGVPLTSISVAVQ